MNVTRGWSTDYGKMKFSVMVEEADLLRMLAERGADDPVKTAADMPTRHVYLIMDAEAQVFVYHSLAKQEPGQQEQHMAKAAEHRTQRDALLDKYTAPAF
jgi:hypothetical protein